MNAQFKQWNLLRTLNAMLKLTQSYIYAFVGFIFNSLTGNFVVDFFSIRPQCWWHLILMRWWYIMSFILISNSFIAKLPSFFQQFKITAISASKIFLCAFYFFCCHNINRTGNNFFASIRVEEKRDSRKSGIWTKIHLNIRD